MNNKEKWVLIVEKSNNTLTVNKKDYVLEGVFAQFGVENNNHRIYEEKEYLPHLEYLQEKIEKKGLPGELDHPEKFDISLKNVSHVVEALEYNKDKRQVLGKIKLLDTAAGRDAKAMVDGGLQLSISSRAAGVVKEDKKVQIKRIFTYDLVADPGFDNAQLNRVNENGEIEYSFPSLNEELGLPKDSNICVYDMSCLCGTNESVDGESLEDIFKDDEIQVNKNDSIDNMPDKNQNQPVTTKMLEAYTQHIKVKFEELTKLLNEKSAPQSTVDDLKGKVENLTEEVNNLIKFSSYQAEKSNNIARYAEYVLEKTEEVNDDKEKIEETLQTMKDFLDYTSEGMNELANENEGIKKYAEYLKEGLNMVANYTDRTAQNTKVLHDHSNHLVEKINILADYAEYTKDGVNKSINFVEQGLKGLDEKVNNTIKFTEQGLEGLAEGAVPVISTTPSQKTRIKPSENLDEKINSIIESVRKQKTENISEEAGFPYFKLLSPQKQKEFIVLENNQKQKIMSAVHNSKPMNENDFIAIWEEAIRPVDPTKIDEKIIAGMPDEFTKIWESLDSKQQNIILNRAKMYKLSTPYQLKYFWQNQLSERLELQNLNESANTDTPNPSRIYNSEYMNQIAMGLKKFNKR